MPRLFIIAHSELVNVPGQSTSLHGSGLRQARTTSGSVSYPSSQTHSADPPALLQYAFSPQGVDSSKISQAKNGFWLTIINFFATNFNISDNKNICQGRFIELANKISADG